MDELLLDTRGLKSFIDLCRNEKKLEFSDIESLITTKPYEQMLITMKNEPGFRQEQFQRIMAAALIPNEYVLPKELDRCQRHIDHILNAKSRYSELENHLEELHVQLNTQTIIARTKEYLPELAKIGTQRIYSLVFIPDGFGSQRGIFIDPIWTISLTTDGFQGLISHELHHCAMMSLCNPKILSIVLQHDSEDPVPQERFRGIVDALWCLQSEGIADLAYCLTGASFKNPDSPAAKWIERRNSIALLTDVYLKNLNDAMGEVLVGNVPYASAISHITDIFANNAFHPVGYIMAQRIKKQLGGDALIATVGKPYQFILAYQRTARKIGDIKTTYIFDEEILDGLDQIEW